MVVRLGRVGQPGDASTTTYDALGQVVRVADGNGTAAYTYDGLDAVGEPETRGLVTKVTQTSTLSVASHTATAAYDAQGAVTVEKLPGGITRRHTWDEAGELVDLTYSGPCTDPDTGQPITIHWTVSASFKYYGGVRDTAWAGYQYQVYRW